MFRLSAVFAATLAAGCSDSDDNKAPDLQVPETYSFESVFVPPASSVDYQGQICRQVLITALKNAVKDADEIAKADYRGAAVPYFDNTIAGALAAQNTQQVLALQLPVPDGQGTLGELCGTKHLKEKFAGNDTSTDFKDWNTEFGGVAGYTSAEVYLRDLLTEVSEQTAAGTNPEGAPHYVSAAGIDYAELIQKLLLGAVVFSQGADDYLDDDSSTPGKGLLTAFERDGEQPWAKLEHAFDEGYGYFGAARAYADRSDADNTTGVVDDNNDGFIDLNSEHNFGASTNAAKRDVGAAASAPTDFTGDAFGALLRARALISARQSSFADLSAADQADLVESRDAVLAAWEGSVAATVVHYINDVLGDMDKIGTDAYSFTDHAKHYSELKGFALGLQFSPFSPLHTDVGDGTGDSRFVRLNALLRDAPALTNEQAYRDDLLEARALLGVAYGFAQANLEAW